MAINSLSSASKGLSGLVSGLDTQGMVDAMLAGTQAKIDKAKAQKTVLTYKQTTYRELLSKLTTFRDSFMSFGSKSSTNLFSSDFYNTMNAVSSSSAFKVSATSSSAAGKTSINAIHQLARATSIKTNKDVAASGVVKGTLNLSELEGKEIQIQLDGVSKTIKLPGSDGSAVTNADAFRSQLQSAINKAFGNGIVVKGSGNELILEGSDSSREFIVTGNSDAMSVLGMTTGTSNKINTNLRLDQINFSSELQGESFEFSINGESFSFSGSDTLSTVISTINRSDANVKLRYSALDDKFVMESTVSGKDVTIEMDQTDGNLLTAMFGVSTGGNFTGDSVSYTGSMTGSIMGGKVSDYVPGEKLSDEESANVKALFESMAAELNRMTESGDATFIILLDGGDKATITLPKRELNDPNDPDSGLKEYTVEDMVNAINENETLKAQGVSLTLEKETDADGHPLADGAYTGAISLNVPEGQKITLSSNLANMLGTKTNNVRDASGSDTLAMLGVGDFTMSIDDGSGSALEVNLTSDMTVDDVAAAIQSKLHEAGYVDATVDFGSEKNKAGFRVCGIDIPMSFDMGDAGEKLVGSKTFSVNQDGPTMEVTEGRNAVFSINGIMVERNKNDFTIDGINYELQQTFNTNAVTDANGNVTGFEVADTNVEESVTVTRDTEKIYNGIVSFMEEYNKIVDYAWGLLKEDANYRDYPPLTDSQKGSMTEKEIELWETKSKEGLLRGDSTIEGIMDAMRRTLLGTSTNSKYSLADLGITTSYDMEKGYGGKLVFSSGGADTLKALISQEPEEIEKLFSNSEDGLIVELNKVMRGATSATSTEAGKMIEYGELSLANLAGRTGMSDTSSTIYKQIREINSTLETLNLKYESEYARYWKQFNSMEQIISNMNQQSSWLSQQFQ